MIAINLCVNTGANVLRSRQAYHEGSLMSAAMTLLPIKVRSRLCPFVFVADTEMNAKD